MESGVQAIVQQRLMGDRNPAAWLRMDLTTHPADHAGVAFQLNVVEAERDEASRRRKVCQRALFLDDTVVVGETIQTEVERITKSLSSSSGSACCPATCANGGSGEIARTPVLMDCIAALFVASDASMPLLIAR